MSLPHKLPGASLKHIPPLDGIRALAVLMVLLVHCVQFNPETKFDHYLLRVCSSTWIGVDLFFVLSGYLITLILLRTKESPTYFISFYARRALRIFPLYFLFVAFAIYIVPMVSTLRHVEPATVYHKQWWYWLYFSNFLAAKEGAFRHAFLSPTWTLAIEEQFYLVWPFVVCLCSLRWLTIISAGLVCLAPILRWILFDLGISGQAIHTMTFTRFDAIAMGSVIACYSIRGAISDIALRRARLLMFVLGAIHLYCVRLGLVHKTQPFMIQYGYTIVTLLFGLLILTVVNLRDSSVWYKALTSPLLVRLGGYSYAVYLFNRPLVPYVKRNVFDPSTFPTVLNSQAPGQLVFFMIVTLLSVVLAVASWWLIERNFLLLKRYFPSMPPSPAPDVKMKSYSPETVECLSQADSSGGSRSVANGQN